MGSAQWRPPTALVQIWVGITIYADIRIDRRHFFVTNANKTVEVEGKQPRVDSAIKVPSRLDCRYVYDSLDFNNAKLVRQGSCRRQALPLTLRWVVDNPGSWTARG
jgi:hypothetical protein